MKLKFTLSQLPNYARNFYFLVGIFFVVWMVFFDSNSFISQYRLSAKLNELKGQKAYYQEKINEVNEERQALFSNPQQLEKFARENYRMKKKTEDLYVIVEEN